MLFLDMFQLKPFFHDGQRRPWFTEELDKLIEERDSRYNSYRRTWTDHDLQLKVSEEAKLLFYLEMLRDLHESDKIWKELRNLGLILHVFLQLRNLILTFLAYHLIHQLLL